jgi:hypothetical protein
MSSNYLASVFEGLNDRWEKIEQGHDGMFISHDLEAIIQAVRREVRLPSFTARINLRRVA